MGRQLGSKAAWLALAIVVASCLFPGGVTAKTGQMGSFGGVTVAGSPYRYAAFPARTLASRRRSRGSSATVAGSAAGGRCQAATWCRPSRRPRQRRRSVGRRRDPGPEPALADLSAAGIAVRGAEDAVQLRVEWPRSPTALPSVPEIHRRTGQLRLQRDLAGRRDGVPHPLSRLRDHEAGTKPSDDFEIRALDLESGRLAPRPLARAPRQRGPLTGVPITRVSSGDGRWAYTLYLGDRRPSTCWRSTPSPAARSRSSFRACRAGQRAGKCAVAEAAPGSGRTAADCVQPLTRPRRRQATGQGRHEHLHGSAGAERYGEHRRDPPWVTDANAAPDPFLAFTQTPRHPGNLLARIGVAGHSAGGRRIGMRQTGDPGLNGELLVFGCIHGDECAASGIQPRSPLTAGCPDPKSDVYVVPNLNPDGAARGSRLNGRGVDLNRNFPAGWKSIGSRGDPQYSGPRPFSEPETRLAARIVRRLEPEVTIWFHQHRGRRPFVRAWGPSAPSARELRAWRSCRSGSYRGLRGRRRTGRTIASRAPARSSSSCRRDRWRKASARASATSLVRLGRQVSED